MLIKSYLDLARGGSLGSNFLLPLPQRAERSGFEGGFPLTWAGSGRGHHSEVVSGLKLRYLIQM